MIYISELSKTFSGQKVLNNLSLEIQKGEVVALIGSSGAGYFSNQVASKQVIDEIPAQLPILVISGQEDPLGENGKGIERFVKLLKASHSKVSLRLVEEARHEILNEINRQDTYHFLADWMTKNMDG